ERPYRRDNQTPEIRKPALEGAARCQALASPPAVREAGIVIGRITDAQLAAALLNHGWHPSFTHRSNRSIFSCDQGPSPLGGGGGMTEPPIPRIRSEILSDRALTSPKLRRAKNLDMPWTSLSVKSG